MRESAKISAPGELAASFTSSKCFLVIWGDVWIKSCSLALRRLHFVLFPEADSRSKYSLPRTSCCEPRNTTPPRSSAATACSDTPSQARTVMSSSQVNPAAAALQEKKREKNTRFSVIDLMIGSLLTL